MVMDSTRLEAGGLGGLLEIYHAVGPEARRIFLIVVYSRVALPGGIGTLEELMEVWTSGALAMHDKPVVALDPWGDFALLRAQVVAWIDRGFVSLDSLKRVRWVVTVDEAFEALTAPVLPSADSVME